MVSISHWGMFEAPVREIDAAKEYGGQIAAWCFMPEIDWFNRQILSGRCPTTCTAEYQRLNFGNERLP